MNLEVEVISKLVRNSVLWGAIKLHTFLVQNSNKLGEGDPGEVIAADLQVDQEVNCVRAAVAKGQGTLYSFSKHSDDWFSSVSTLTCLTQVCSHISQESYKENSTET